MTSHPHQQPTPTIGVLVDRAVDGAYVPTVVVGEDLSIPLPGERAEEYAAVVLMAAEYARYDAAVIAQMRHLAADKPEEFVNALLADILRTIIDNRPVLDDTPTAPLRFQPIVSASTGRPYLHVWVNGARVCQWDPADAAGHAMHVLQATVWSRLDETYRRVLHDVVGLDEGLAAAAVHSLADHQHGPDPEES